ncbi:MAG TPA: hypothetical protein VF488_06400, partial [Gemmatimonadaceae bacterium]
TWRRTVGKRRFPTSGGVITCDHPGCEARFVSYSMISKLRPQAKNAGWGRVHSRFVVPPGEEYMTEQSDICPDHVPAAAERKANWDAERAELKKKDSAEKKRERMDRRNAKRKKARAAAREAAKAQAMAEVGGEA